LSDSDPFADRSDRTILRPSPGRGRGGQAGTPPPHPATSGSASVTPEQVAGSGVNPLVAAAGALFSLVTQLRNTTSHHDVGSLFTHVAQDIKTFEASARNAGESAETILAARYALCTLLDETALSTPWGAESSWADETLLVRFHKETYGGEKFFQVLERSMQDPSRNLHLIEFMYVCMSLGLEGLYRVQEDGQRKLQQIVDQTYEAIRRYRADFDRELSPSWRGAEDRRPKLARYVPLWSIFAVAGCLLLLVYAGFLYALNSSSDPVVGQIAALGRDAREPENARPTSTPARAISLAELLVDDIRDGFVEVDDQPGRSVVRLWALFDSGKAKVHQDQRPLLERVGNALSRYPGAIKISGHTDDIPIRSLRFPSNWILSERRAESVFRGVATIVPQQRLSFEGLADSVPLVPNDSAVNRAINRRVELTLYPEAQDL
jgi:type VI secretion system protein ImpK